MLEHAAACYWGPIKKLFSIRSKKEMKISWFFAYIHARGVSLAIPGTFLR